MTSDPDGKIQIWDTASLQIVEDPGQEYPTAVSLATSSGFLAFGAKDKVQIADLSGNGGSAELEAPGANTLLAFDQTGSVLASTDSSGRLHIWKYQDGEFTAVPPLIREQAASLAINADGTLLAVGGARNVFLIDTATGREVARIPHRDTVSGVSFSPDGTYLTTASSKVLQLWEIAKIEPVQSDELIPAACSRLFENFSPAQWSALFRGEEYQTLCENLPVPE
jgi:WD40 repeat protein